MRARQLGITLGLGTPGELNAITDVPGVRVGHSTIKTRIDGKQVR
ncbi:MAG: S58 family peptidase, partial [Pseudomonadota bacterium]|nr:S58 family peptidase [Pseudomonadota bacterium]